MNKEEIIKCVVSSLKLIDLKFDEYELRFVKSELRREKFQSLEDLVTHLDQVPYHTATDIANQYCERYKTQALKFKDRYWRISGGQK